MGKVERIIIFEFGEEGDQEQLPARLGFVDELLRNATLLTAQSEDPSVREVARCLVVDDEIKEELKQINSLEERLTVVIGKASELTGATQTQLRYWQDEGILSVENKEGKFHRFSILDLREIAVIVKLADRGLSPRNIRKFIDASNDLSNQPQEI